MLVLMMMRIVLLMQRRRRWRRRLLIKHFLLSAPPRWNWSHFFYSIGPDFQDTKLAPVSGAFIGMLSSIDLTPFFHHKTASCFVIEPIITGTDGLCLFTVYPDRWMLGVIFDFLAVIEKREKDKIRLSTCYLVIRVSHVRRNSLNLCPNTSQLIFHTQQNIYSWNDRLADSECCLVVCLFIVWDCFT